MSIDLRTCKKGDILISSHGAKLEYISPTPWKYYTYLDHVVRYIEDKEGKSMGDENYGTRTNDGHVFAKNRIPEFDHDIVEILKKEIPKWVLENLCYYDKRNPDCTADEDEIEYNKYYTSKKECSCDNCFYGRTKLAEYVIEILKKEL